MRVPAPAKINLHLRVGPRQADGFHPLLTWMTTIGLFDTLTIVRRRAPTLPASRSESSRWFSLSCSDPSLPVDGSNLVTRAARALADALSQVGEGLTDPTKPRDAASAFLVKRIPRGAGLGGGSSDAAAALIGLNRFWGLKLPFERLMSIAADLGSDVPFFLQGLSCVCSGRGEHVRPIDPPGTSGVKLAAALITPPFELSTADVYRRFDEMGLGSEEAIEDKPNWAVWTKCSARELMPQLVNDLEPAAFSLRRELGELRAKLEETLSRPVRMSGSGSSLFVLCDDADEAKSQVLKVKESLGVGAMDVEIARARVSGVI